MPTPASTPVKQAPLLLTVPAEGKIVNLVRIPADLLTEDGDVEGGGCTQDYREISRLWKLR